MTESPAEATPRISVLPGLTDLPRESAVETIAVAQAMLANVRQWAQNHPADDISGAARMRRELKPVVATIDRRNLSTAATLDAKTAARLVDRALGVALRMEIGDRPLGKVRVVAGVPVDEWTQGDYVTPLYRFADLTLDDFEAAVARARAKRRASVAAILWELDNPGRGEVEPEAEVEPEQQPVTDWRMTAVEATKLVEAIAYALAPAGDPVAGIGRRSVADVEAAVAADLARKLWDALVPAMALHSALRVRGKRA